MRRSRINKKRPIKKILVGLIAAAFVATALIVLEARGVTDFWSATTTEPKDNSAQEFSPPTLEEKEAGDRKKNEIIEGENQSGGESQANVGVVIVDASQYGDTVEIRAFATNILKDGECTFAFSLDQLSFVKKTPAYADASTTPCVALSLPASEFEKTGQWSLEVSYEAEGVGGKSSTTLEIME